MAVPSIGGGERRSCLARGQFSSRTVFDLDGDWLTACRIRRGAANGSHGPASAAHDAGSCVAFAGRSADAVLAWLAAALRARRSGSLVSVGARAAGRARTFATGVLLVRRRRGPGGMAYSRSIYVGVAIGRVARGGAHLFPHCRISFLVAGGSALDECLEKASMVDSFVPFSRDFAVRHPFRISCFFGAGGLSSLSFRATPVR